MLLKALQSCQQKKTLEEYRSYLMKVSYVILMLSILGIILSFVIRANDFASGLLLGSGSSGLIVAIYYWIVCHQPKRLKNAYIAAYDERNQFILRMTAVSMLVMMFLINFVLIILYAFFSVELSYITLLLIWLYSLSLGFLILRGILSKIL